MARYKVTQDVRAQTNSPMLGRVAVTFTKGNHEPKNEGEELVLKGLVRRGLAEVVVEKSSKPTTEE